MNRDLLNFGKALEQANEMDPTQIPYISFEYANQVGLLYKLDIILLILFKMFDRLAGIHWSICKSFKISRSPGNVF